MASGSASIFARRELTGLEPAVLAKLNSAGYRTYGDISAAQPDELAQELGISEDEANRILHIVAQASSGGTQASQQQQQPSSQPSVLSQGGTASQMLSEVEMRRAIVTFSQKIDKVGCHARRQCAAAF